MIKGIGRGALQIQRSEEMVRGIVSVEAFVFRRTDKGPAFLLLKRTPARGGFWQPVSGRMQDLEGLLQTACRELREETGIPDTVQVMDLAHSFVFYAGGKKYLVRSFALEVDCQEVALSSEHDEFRWTTYEEAMSLLALRGDKEALHKLYAERLKCDAPDLEPATPRPVRPKSGIAVLVDFDGTTTIEEASIEILEEFATDDWKKYDDMLFSGEITLQECIGEQFSLVKAPRVDIDKMLEQKVRLRPGFRELVEHCQKEKYAIAITSGGLDFYIETLLAHHGFTDIPYYADSVIFAGEAGMVVEPGYPDHECEDCGNCKARLVKEYRGMDCKVVYIGDGISDHCPARFADVVIARRSLLKYCRENGIAHHEFGDFHDALNILKEVV
jgi:2-hydroxy-3-keto-5-methylthiopentenyl-1-phosphate phosphatase